VVEALLVSQFVAAASMLLLAGWLLWLNFRSPVNRAFALFLFFRAAVTLANRMKGFAEDGGDASGQAFWLAIREYYSLALAPTLLYFWVVYANVRPQAFWRPFVLVAGLLIEGAYMADHCLDNCRSASGLIHLGPLSWMATPGSILATALVGFLVLMDALRKDGPRARAAHPVAMGLLLGALLEASFAGGQIQRLGAATFAQYEPSFWRAVYYVPIAVALGLVLAALALSVAVALRRPADWLRLQAFSILGVLVGASGWYVGWNIVLSTNWLPGIFLLGLWRILLPALVAYSLVRHRLFDVDVRMRFALKGTSLAGIFLAVFFVVNKVTENLVASRFGQGNAGIYAGGAVAGLLLFALSPLQRVVERFSQAVLPHSKPMGSMTDPERLALYRHQAVLVWSDGAMGRKERARLDRLRARLAIPADEAIRIEAEAANQSLQAPSTKPGRSGASSPK